MANRVEVALAEIVLHKLVPEEFRFGNSGLWKAVAERVGHDPAMAPEFLGRGTQGAAYRLSNDTVLKISFDSSEALAMETVRQNPHQLVVNVLDVFSVFVVEGFTYYCVHQECLDPAEEDWKDFAESLKSVLIVPDVIDSFISTLSHEDIVQCSDQIEWVRALAEHLSSIGLDFKDLRNKNIMRRGKQHVVIDLGYSSGADQEIDILCCQEDFDVRRSLIQTMQRLRPAGLLMSCPTATGPVHIKLEGTFFIRNRVYIQYTLAVGLPGQVPVMIPVDATRQWKQLVAQDMLVQADAASITTDTSYHVTFLKNLDRIRTTGRLKPGRGENFSGYTGHAKGKLFLTEWAGVKYWMGKLEYVAHSESDDPIEEGFIPVVLAVGLDDLTLQDDPLGTRDAMHEAYWTAQSVPVTGIKFWNGSAWISVLSFDLEEMTEAAQAAATLDFDKNDDGEPEEFYWPDYDVFQPHSKAG